MHRHSPPVDVAEFVARHLDAGDPTGWFEPVYAAAGRDLRRVPWARGEPHPYLVDWLEEPVATPAGSRAVVVGCGAGDDAALLADHDVEVVAFDVSASAIAIARRRFRRTEVAWRVADLLALPDELIGAFDLVVEIDTVPWLPGVVRDAAMQAVASLAAPGGVAVTVTRLATSEEARAGAHGPPWPQAPSELAAYRAGGLVQVALEHPTPDGSPVMDARITWHRPAGGGAAGLPLAGGPLSRPPAS